MIDFDIITTEDTGRYITYLKDCPEVPADCYSAFAFGYNAVWPSARGYAHGLCWQQFTRDLKTLWYPPMGSWKDADWEKIFALDIPPFTTFTYVPRPLKELWERMPGASFAVKECRNDWDYIYELNQYSKGTKHQRRLCRRFKESYEHTVEEINADNLSEVRALNSEANASIRTKNAQDYTELESDDIAMECIVSNWEALGTVEGILMRVAGRPVSYAIWDVIDDRAVLLFNKNIYEYKGVHEILTSELCRINLERGRKWLNSCCDAGIEGLREAKESRKPFRMLEKYEMQWLGS